MAESAALGWPPPAARGPRSAVVIADDQQMVRSGLRVILETEPGISGGGRGRGRPAEAVELARRHRPAVALLDIRMPVLDGLHAARKILAVSPPTRVLILTTFDSDEYVYEALRAGASGFLLKDAPADQLITAVRSLAAGDALIDPVITRRLISRFTLAARGPVDLPEELRQLTARERDVAPPRSHASCPNLEITQGPGSQGEHDQDHVSRMLDEAGHPRPGPGRSPGLRTGIYHPRTARPLGHPDHHRNAGPPRHHFPGPGPVVLRGDGRHKPHPRAGRPDQRRIPSVGPGGGGHGMDENIYVALPGTPTGKETQMNKQLHARLTRRTAIAAALAAAAVLSGGGYALASTNSTGHTAKPGNDSAALSATAPQQVFHRSASRRGSDRAGLLLRQHPGDPDRRPASALLELITDHCRLILDRHRADGDQVLPLVPHHQHVIHVAI